MSGRLVSRSLFLEAMQSDDNICRIVKVRGPRAHALSTRDAILTKNFQLGIFHHVMMHFLFSRSVSFQD